MLQVTDDTCWQWGWHLAALHVAAVLLGDAGQRLQSKGLEERCGIERGQMFIACGRASAMHGVGGQKTHLAANAIGADRFGCV